MVRKTLNEYKWRPDTDFSKIVVYYVDRIDPRGYRTMSGDEIEDMGDKFIFRKDGGMIPYHRVIKIEYAGKVVWKKVHQDE